MSELILHHYASSPFSEKVRLVLGLKGMRWRSVTVPSLMPKPDVVALTGGYRRTPFMQIGADVYCDSALMCRVIDALTPEPPLYPEATRGLAEIVAQWADSALFWSAVPYTMQPAGVAHIFRDLPVEAVKAFGADRAAMTPLMRRAPTADAGAAVRAYLGRLEAMLARGGPFLLGGAPSIADVSAAQSVWFIRRAPPVAEILSPFAEVGRWYERVVAFGQGSSEPMTSGEAIGIARASTSFAPASIAAGEPFAARAAVTVAASDYGHDEVEGELVGLDVDEIVVERRDDRAGVVRVHFPRLGFHVRAPKKEAS